MIKITNIKKNYGDVKAVRDISFEIQKGEVVGFLGPNGAGKTTMLKMIAGIIESNKGEITIDGKETIQDKVAAKKKIGYLAENNPLYEEMPVQEYLKLAADLKGISKDKRKEAIKKVVKSTGIESVYYRLIGDLSKGFKQRVGLAQAILGDPEILLLDEPTEGLDPNQRVDIRTLITSLGKEKTVMVSTHVLGEATSMCDRLIVLDNGKVAADGSVDELQNKVSKNNRVQVEVEADSEVRNDLLGVDGVLEVISENDKQNRTNFVLLVESAKQVTPKIFELAKQKGWTLWNLHQEEANLENVFRSLTRKE
ncbi:MAG: ATP-binding cassette domain-containing protein [bacterium]